MLTTDKTEATCDCIAALEFSESGFDWDLDSLLG